MIDLINKCLSIYKKELFTVNFDTNLKLMKPVSNDSEPNVII